MSEKIKLTGNDNDPADIFLLEAMCEVDETLKAFLLNIDQHKGGHVEVDVVFTVNGVTVPFAPVAKGLFDRAQAEIDQQVMEKAKELVTASGLDPVIQAMQEAEWKIEAVLAETLKNKP